MTPRVLRPRLENLPRASTARDRAYTELSYDFLTTQSTSRTGRVRREMGRSTGAAPPAIHRTEQLCQPAYTDCRRLVRRAVLQVKRTVAERNLDICWTGETGERLALAVLCYQFPDDTDGYDANWVKVSVAARNQAGSWSRECSCILAWELAWISRWLDHVAAGCARDSEYFGLEPDLALEYVAASEGKHRLLVRLSDGLSRTGRPGQTDLVNVSLQPEELSKRCAISVQLLTAFRREASRVCGRGHCLARRSGPRVDHCLGWAAGSRSLAPLESAA